MFNLIIVVGLIVIGFLLGYFCTAPIHGYKTIKTQIIAGIFGAFCVAIFIGVIVWVYAILSNSGAL